jgi:hypothetical protein
MSTDIHSKDDAAYITIVEGPPPDFSMVNKYWTASLAEGPTWSVIAVCKMRTFNGQVLVNRCRDAWNEGRPAFLDYPRAFPDTAHPSGRGKVEIVAVQWEKVTEGQVIFLWVRTEDLEEIDVEIDFDVDDEGDEFV